MFLERYDVGTLVSAKGIAEGVENTNYLVETTGGRFILTLYEKRVDADDLPYFLGLTEHLAEKGLPVPAPIRDREGRALQMLNGRHACLIEFLSGVSVSAPTAAHAREAGETLAGLHRGAADFDSQRANALSLSGWLELAASLGGRLGEIDKSLPDLVTQEMTVLAENWPQGLPSGNIHADMFPDNVLFSDSSISGVIDFYFACTDMLAYDLAVTHAAWAFDDEGALQPGIGETLVESYHSHRPLSDEEREALPTLCRGAALRFLLTRAYDWLNTPADAVVVKKDPMAFARRLLHYHAA